MTSLGLIPRRVHKQIKCVSHVHEKKIRGCVVRDAAPTSDITRLLHILHKVGSLTNLHVAVSTGYCNGWFHIGGGWQICTRRRADWHIAWINVV